MTQPLPTIASLLKDYVTANKLTPSQEARVLLDYVKAQRKYPALPFDYHLQGVARTSGDTKENRQDPEDALNYHCPTKGSAFPPKKRSEYLIKYIELQSLLAQQGKELTLDDYLTMELATNGEAAAATALEPVVTPAPVQTVPAAPVVEQSDALKKFVPTDMQPGLGTYTDISGNVHQGLIYRVYIAKSGENKASFVSTTGMLVEDAELSHCASQPGEVPTYKLKLSKADYNKAAQYLSLPDAVGSVKMGEPLLAWECALPIGKACISVYNARPAPGVDAMLLDSQGKLLFELAPRGELLGYYPLVYEHQIFIVEVTH